MTTKVTITILAFLLLPVLVSCGQAEAPASYAAEKAISGSIEDGLRVLTFDSSAKDQVFTIYRGDYVRPQVAGGGSFHLEIPELKVDKIYPTPEGEKPYFKAPEVGVYAFQAGEATGTIEVIEFKAASFRDVTAVEGAAFIGEKGALVLDVRTPREFAGGHLENAVLLPVQELQRRMGELAEHKERPILVYCRTGNRSTVASKLLIDAGHREVANLRRGIVDWQRKGMTVLR
jgi:rhodanese-related sulfurtransferase